MSTPSAHPAAPRWLLTIRHTDVDRVFFVHEEDDGLTTWTPMVHSGPGSDRWTLQAPHAAQAGRFKIYTMQNGSVFNCGDAGLSCRLLTAAPTPAGG